MRPWRLLNQLGRPSSLPFTTKKIMPDKFKFTSRGFPVRVSRFRKLKDLVEDIQIGYNGLGRDPSDAFVQSAVWIESSKPLTDKELDDLDIAEALEVVA